VHHLALSLLLRPLSRLPLPRQLGVLCGNHLLKTLTLFSPGALALLQRRVLLFEGHVERRPLPLPLPVAGAGVPQALLLLIERAREFGNLCLKWANQQLRRGLRPHQPLFSIFRPQLSCRQGRSQTGFIGTLHLACGQAEGGLAVSSAIWAIR
jgi:hypothetical protein